MVDTSTVSDDAKITVAQEVGVLPEEELTLDNALSNFRLLPDNAIPIPPTIGNYFQQFFEDGLRALKSRHEEWERNIKEFLNEDGADANYPKENLIRSTVETLVDYTYMRNPTLEFSGKTGEDTAIGQILQIALDNLMNKKNLPGVNLRPKITRQIIYAHLTNFGLLELIFQPEKGSVQQVLEINQMVMDQIKKEDDTEKLGRLYELLDILQRELLSRRNMGIGVRARSPFSLIVDPDCNELDFSDARIIMDRDNMRIDHIRAEYMNYDKEANKYYYKYNPEVEFTIQTTPINTKETAQEQIIQDIMPDVDPEIAKLRTKDTLGVVWVYDRTMRLKYLYVEGQWSIPLWVYADEMQLSRFFPFFALAFSTPLNAVVQAGEVSHYLGFNNEIDRINQQTSHIRNRAFTKYIYNSSAVDREEIERVFNAINSSSAELEAIGVKLKDRELELEKFLKPLEVPSSQFAEIFDKRDLQASLERVTRVNDVMKGAQFRTNTTNDAVETYNEFAQTRTEGLTDKVEKNVEDLLWSMAELMVAHMDKTQIAQFLPEGQAQAFRNMSVEEFNANYNLEVAAGSTEKPTSQAKKRESTQIIQMLGQFGTAAPRTVLTIVSRLLRNAFSRNLVTDQDLVSLDQEAQANMQKGISTEGNGNNV